MATVPRLTGRTMIALLAGSCGLLPLIYPDWRVEAQQIIYYPDDVEERETARCRGDVVTTGGTFIDQQCVVEEDNEGEIRIDNGRTDIMEDNDGYIRNICEDADITRAPVRCPEGSVLMLDGQNNGDISNTGTVDIEGDNEGLILDLERSVDIGDQNNGTINTTGGSVRVADDNEGRIIVQTSSPRGSGSFTPAAGRARVNKDRTRGWRAPWPPSC